MLSSADIERLLALLAAKLVTAEVDATITVAGGATMGLVYHARESTVDIDALLRPVEAVRAAAAEIAIEENLPAEWINNRFAMFWPQHGEPDFSLSFSTAA